MIVASELSFAEAYRRELLGTLATIDVGRVEQAIEWFREARASARHIFVCGNGGSASTASHFVCDMVKGANYERPERFAPWL